MKSWKKNAFGLGAMITVAAVAVLGLSRCTPSDRSTEELTESEEADLNQKAMEAEMAEAKIAQVVVKGAPTGPVAATTAAAPKKDAPKDAPKAAAKDAKVAAKPEVKAEAAAAKPVAKADTKANAKVESKAVAKTDAKPAAAKAETTRKPASRGSVYVVQVGAFKSKENAEKLQAKLKDLGYPVIMQTIEHSKNGTLHLVRSEPMNDRANAQSVVEKLKEKEVSASVLPVAAGM